MDDHRIEVSVFKDERIVKRKIIKGRVVNNYFEFRFRKFAVKYVILNGYGFQNNRMVLLKDGSLTIDSDAGGFLVLVIIPTFGAGEELYGLVFKRKTDCR